MEHHIYMRAYRLIGHLFCSGKITYYTQPPEQHTLSAHLSADIITEMSKEFDIEALVSDEQDTIQGWYSIFAK